MSTRNVIKAWKNQAYRNSLSAAERAALPVNPAGSIEISDEDLGKVAGGALPISRLCTLTNCTCVYNCIFSVDC
jgi:mersacidin/lichenicidin family type 2 lantibiotic